MIRTKSITGFKLMLESIERHECAWCGSAEPFNAEDVWTVMDFEDVNVGDNPYRYCSPLHASYALAALVDDLNSPEETVDDLQCVQGLLDHFKEKYSD